MPSFFSWQVETVLFFLAEKEKNGFKKAFLWVRRKPEEAGGQSRPPLRVRRKIGGCTDVLKLLPVPHPSASQTPSPKGKAIRCGGDLGGQGGSAAGVYILCIRAGEETMGGVSFR